MKKKFYLALLLIAALCLSAAGMAQSDPQRLVGNWEMEDGDGEFADADDTYPTTADGVAIFIISEVAPDDEDDPTEGTLTFSFGGAYDLELFDDDDDTLVASLTMTMAFNEPDVDFEETDDDTFTLTGVNLEVEIDGVPVEDDTLEVEIEIDLSDPNTATVIISFEEGFTIEIPIPDDDPEIIEIVSGSLTFDATKVPPKPNRPSSGGGCDTGAGFGLFLALGALAVAKRAKRKP